MNLYLGLDIGTTAVKALAVNSEGRVLAQASREYQYQTPRPGWVEQEAEDWWRLAGECVREVVAHCRARAAEDLTVVALAVSTQGDTMVPLKAGGRPLAPAITWMDTRCRPLVTELEAEHDLWVKTTGAAPAAFSAATSLLWWRRERPEVFAQAARFALVSDFLNERLTGQAVADAPNASRTGVYDIVRRDWSDELLQRIGVGRARLPEAAEAGTVIGTVRPEVAAQWGLSPRTQVVLGGHDQTCAALGCGVIEPGSLLLSCGTAWVVLAATQGPVWDAQESLHTYCHAVPGGYVSLGAFAGGNLLRWFRDNLWEGLSPLEGPGITRPAVRNGSSSPVGKADEQPTAGRVIPGPSNGHDTAGDAYDAITAEAERARAEGRPPLLFLPHFYGATAPVRCAEALGGWAGLTLAHTRGDLALALLQGVALQATCAVESLRRQGAPVEQIRMIGGGARSRFWTQLVADATQATIVLPQVSEAAALGAALLAATAAGEFADLRQAAGTVALAGEVRPQRPPDAVAVGRLTRLMTGLRPVWEGLASAGD